MDAIRRPQSAKGAWRGANDLRFGRNGDAFIRVCASVRSAHSHTCAMVLMIQPPQCDRLSVQQYSQLGISTPIRLSTRVGTMHQCNVRICDGLRELKMQERPR